MVPPGIDASDPRRRTPLWARTLLWAAWLAAALYASLHHVMWRDEIRALSLSQRGDSLGHMIEQIRGFGHPTLWHVILRSGQVLQLGNLVLPVAAFAIGAAGSALLAFRAPFRPLFLTLALFGAFSAYEYVAVARNYGLSVLLLYATAALWGRYRDRPGVIAALLFLLCNANVHSVVLAGALLLFWFVELLGERPAPRRALVSFAAGALAVLIGTALCFWQVYPPVDTAAMAPHGDGGLGAFLGALVLNLGPSFHELMPEPLRTFVPVVLVLPVLLILAVVSLRERPAAMIAAAAALVGLAVVFALIYQGYYRHQALFLAFVLTLSWIVADRPDARRGPLLGRVGLTLLLVLQLWSSVIVFTYIARGVPESRVRDLAQLLDRPALRDAIVIGDPDTMIEALPYYRPNPLYFVRENRFGRTPIFSHAAETEMSLGRLLAAAHMLHARTGRPVVIALEQRLSPDMPGSLTERGYYGPLRIDPSEVRAFLAATRRVARFAQATTDESYDIYVLDGKNGAAGED